eukprot:8057554-Ditylum_brightwellii.AAC.1
MSDSEEEQLEPGHNTAISNDLTLAAQELVSLSQETNANPVGTFSLPHEHSSQPGLPQNSASLLPNTSLNKKPTD